RGRKVRAGKCSGSASVTTTIGRPLAAEPLRQPAIASYCRVWFAWRYSKGCVGAGIRRHQGRVCSECRKATACSRMTSGLALLRAGQPRSHRAAWANIAMQRTRLRRAADLGRSAAEGECTMLARLWDYGWLSRDRVTLPVAASDAG